MKRYTLRDNGNGFSASKADDGEWTLWGEAQVEINELRKVIEERIVSEVDKTPMQPPPDDAIPTVSDWQNWLDAKDFRLRSLPFKRAKANRGDSHTTIFRMVNGKMAYTMIGTVLFDLLFEPDEPDGFSTVSEYADEWLKIYPDWNPGGRLAAVAFGDWLRTNGHLK